MPTYNIVVFGGDHCGPEVTAEALKVTNPHIDLCIRELDGLCMKLSGTTGH